MNTILVNPLLLLCQLRSGSLGPPTLFFILHSKSNSHEGADLVLALFKYYHLYLPASLDRPGAFSLNVWEEESWEVSLRWRENTWMFSLIYSPTISIRNYRCRTELSPAQPSTATTVVNCYKRDLISPAEIIHWMRDHHRYRCIWRQMY